MKKTSRRYFVELIIAGALVLIAGIIFLNRQNIADQFSYWSYTPSGAIERLAGEGGLSDKGKFYLYSAQPSLLSSVDFSYHCGTNEISAAILGCYKDRRIYIYDVENEKLDGVRTVTAAHEMLHAVYVRLSSTEKDRIDALLETEYNKIKDDPDFKERMEFYDKHEPGERDNELHSIIGTEVKSISPELEEYYKQYFTDRQKVVASHAKYIDTFTTLQKKSDKLVKKLNSLADSINKRKEAYNKSVATFNDEVTKLKNQASSGKFSSYAEYEARRQKLIAESNDLNETSRSINADIKKYNSLKDDLDKLGHQYEELVNSLDSSIVESPDTINSN